VALHHHAEGVADQEHVDAGLVAKRREARVVAREHGDLLAALAQLPEMRQRMPHRLAACG
jgi:hypothetical protein